MYIMYRYIYTDWLFLTVGGDSEWNEVHFKFIWVVNYCDTHHLAEEPHF